MSSHKTQVYFNNVVWNDCSKREEEQTKKVVLAVEKILKSVWIVKSPYGLCVSHVDGVLWVADANIPSKLHILHSSLCHNYSLNLTLSGKTTSILKTQRETISTVKILKRLKRVQEIISIWRK